MKTGSSAPRVWLNPVAVWELLDQLDISQNQLARRAGIFPGHLSLLMNGKRSPAPAVRRRLMKALGVDDFHFPFVMEQPAAAGGRTRGGPAPPNAEKGGTPGQTGRGAGGNKEVRSGCSLAWMTTLGFRYPTRGSGLLHHPYHHRATDGHFHVQTVGVQQRHAQ